MKFECMMWHSGAHETRVTMIVPHPSICGFLTYSNDGPNGKMQVWSCNFRETIEAFTDSGKVIGISVDESGATLVTLGEKLNYFTMHQMYCFFAPLTYVFKVMLLSKQILNAII